MSVKVSKFPSQNWDGSTINRNSREDDIDPNFDDYDQLVAEIIATQVELVTLLGNVVLANGSVPLTANWDAGPFKITALQFESDIVTGTAPLIVASTTVVANLNADTVDGIDGADLIVKGGGNPFTGRQKFTATFQEWVDMTDGASIAFDLDDGNKFRVTLSGISGTLVINDASSGAQAFVVKLTQDATGSRTVTFFNTISWAGGSEPTLTTTPNKSDSFVFVRTGTSTYDGFILGQDI